MVAVEEEGRCSCFGFGSVSTDDCQKEYTEELSAALFTKYAKTMIARMKAKESEPGFWLYSIRVPVRCDCVHCEETFCHRLKRAICFRGKPVGHMTELWFESDPNIMFQKVSNEPRVAKTAKPLRGLFLSYADHNGPHCDDPHLKMLLMAMNDDLLNVLHTRTTKKVFFDRTILVQTLREIAEKGKYYDAYGRSRLYEFKQILEEIEHLEDADSSSSEDEDVPDLDSYSKAIEKLDKVNKALPKCKRIVIPTVEEFLQSGNKLGKLRSVQTPAEQAEHDSLSHPVSGAIGFEDDLTNHVGEIVGRRKPIRYLPPIFDPTFDPLGALKGRRPPSAAPSSSSNTQGPATAIDANAGPSSGVPEGSDNGSNTTSSASDRSAEGSVLSGGGRTPTSRSIDESGEEGEEEAEDDPGPGLSSAHSDSEPHEDESEEEEEDDPGSGYGPANSDSESDDDDDKPAGPSGASSPTSTAGPNQPAPSGPSTNPGAGTSSWVPTTASQRAKRNSRLQALVIGPPPLAPLVALGAKMQDGLGPKVLDPALRLGEQLPFISGPTTGYTAGRTDGTAGPGEFDHATTAPGLATAEDNPYSHKMTSLQRYKAKEKVLRHMMPNSTNAEIAAHCAKLNSGQADSRELEMYHKQLLKLRLKYVQALDSQVKTAKSYTTAVKHALFGPCNLTYRKMKAKPATGEKPPANARFTEFKPQVRKKGGMSGWYTVFQSFPKIRDWMERHGELLDSFLEFMPSKFTKDDAKKMIQEIADLYKEGRLRGFEVFQKEEFTTNWRGRYIVSSAQMTAAMAVVAACAEDLTMGVLGTFTSKKASRDHAVRAHTCFGHGLMRGHKGDNCIGQDDFSSMDASAEAHIDWEVRTILRPIAEIFMGTMDARLQMVDTALKAKSKPAQTCNLRRSAKLQPVQVKFLRQRYSGDRFTSIGNLWFNVNVFFLTHAKTYASKSFASLVAANAVRCTNIEGAERFYSHDEGAYGDGLVKSYRFSGSAFPTLYAPQAKGEGSVETKYNPRWEGDDSHIYWAASAADVERRMPRVDEEAAQFGVDIAPSRRDVTKDWSFTNFLGMEIGHRKLISDEFEVTMFPNLLRAAKSLSAVKKTEYGSQEYWAIMKGNLKAYGAFYSSLTDVANMLDSAAEEIYVSASASEDVSYKLTGVKSGKLPAFAAYLNEVEHQKLFAREITFDSLCLRGQKDSDGADLTGSVEVLREAVTALLADVPEQPKQFASWAAFRDFFARGKGN